MATLSSDSNNAFLSCLMDLSFPMDDALAMPPNFEHQISSSSSLVADMPTVSVSDEDDTVCSVCMEEFESGIGGKQVQCGHVYHATCIASWLSSSNSCPLCRFNISG